MSGDRIDDWEIQYPIAWESEDSWATLYGETGAEAVQDAIVTGATAAINEEIAVGTDLINDTLTLYDTLTYAGGVPYSLRAPQESQTSTLAKVGFSFQMMAEEEEDGPCDPQLRDYQEALAGEVLAFAGMVGAALSPGVGWAGFSLVYAGWVYVDNIAENRRGRLNLCRVNTFVFYVRQPG